MSPISTIATMLSIQQCIDALIGLVGNWSREFGDTQESVSLFVCLQGVFADG